MLRIKVFYLLLISSVVLSLLQAAGQGGLAPNGGVYRRVRKGEGYGSRGKSIQNIAS